MQRALRGLRASAVASHASTTAPRAAPLRAAPPRAAPLSSLGHRLRGAALNRRESFDEAVGNTPLLLLRGPSAATGCSIYGKCEFMNPAGSVKDRAALGLVSAAESAGLIGPGSTIVEGTAGNTGIGLAAVTATRGMRCVIVIRCAVTNYRDGIFRRPPLHAAREKFAP